jgi:serine/threonine protein kinase
VLDRQGRPKLTDFDLVRALDTTGGTRTGSMLGTVVYAAPELLFRPQDARVPADIYGLAMTTVFALYGTDLPPEALWNASGFVEGLETSAGVKRVLQKAVAREARARYASVEAFCQALGRPPEVPLAPAPALPPDAQEQKEPQELPKTPVPGLRDTLADSTPGPMMVWLPRGVFTMGENDSPLNREKPAHEVTVSAFSIGQYLVTFEEYDRFCEATGREKPDDSGWGRETRPVIHVSW